jgi:hypothetical protein
MNPIKRIKWRSIKFIPLHFIAYKFQSKLLPSLHGAGRLGTLLYMFPEAAQSTIISWNLMRRLEICKTLEEIATSIFPVRSLKMEVAVS